MRMSEKSQWSVENDPLLAEAEKLGNKVRRVLNLRRKGTEDCKRARSRIERVLIQAGFLPEIASQLAFHLSDWSSEVAFLLAVQVSPEEFTEDEILNGLSAFLAHAPNHLAAAAKLFGLPVQDIFEVGALSED